MKKLIFLIFAFLVPGIWNISAQTCQIDTIDHVTTEARHDSLIVSFNLNTAKEITAVSLKISTPEGKQLYVSSLDKKAWNKASSATSKSVVYAFKPDGVDLSGQDILIDVEATVLIPKPVKPEKITRFPLYGGVQVALNDQSLDGTFTLEYIAKPWLSILSGIGGQWAELDYNLSEVSCTDCNDYYSVIIPLTAELKLNGGKWFRLYGGGGIQNRILMKEDDRFFNIGQGLNRYILGYVAEAGFEIRNVRIGLTYESDLTPYSIINEKKSCLELSLGWRFGGLSQYRKK